MRVPVSPHLDNTVTHFSHPSRCEVVSEFFSIFWISFSYQIYDLQNFLPLCELPFQLIDGVICSTKELNFNKVEFIYFFSFVTCASSVKSKKPWPYPRSQRLTSLFPKSFIVLALAWRSLIHFELIFVYRGRKEHVWFFRMCLSSCPICWKDCSFPIELSWHPCPKSIDHKCEGLFLDSQLCSIDVQVCPYASAHCLVHTAAR